MIPQKRKISKCILLIILTCGIYAFYWTYKIGGEAASIGNDENAGSIAFVSGLLPSLGLPLAERSLNNTCNKNGVPHKNNTILYLVIGILSFCFPGLALVSAILMQKDLNDLIDNGFIGNYQISEM